LLDDIHHGQYSTESADDAIRAIDDALVGGTEVVDLTGLSAGGGWPDGRNPFPGLQAFDLESRRVFFGRDQEVRELAARLRSPAPTGLIVVVGPSGSGKSSLVRGGLVPAMSEEDGWLVLPPVIPGADPVRALARELAACGVRFGLPWTQTRILGRFEDPGGLAPAAAELLVAASRRQRRHRLLIVVDQIEEAITLSDEPSQARFAELLSRAQADGTLVSIVATIRPEFLTRLQSSPLGAGAELFGLRPVDRARLARLITEPARVAGISIDRGLVERIVADTASGEALPLLAFTMHQLAEGVDRGGTLSSDRYDQLGGVNGALARQADAAEARARENSGRTSRDVISSLLQLVTVDDYGNPTRRRQPLAALEPTVRRELDAFVDTRLVTTDDTGEGATIGVTHEAFLSAWAPLRDAIAETSAALRMRRDVEYIAKEWIAGGRSRRQLWERGQLAAALETLQARIGYTGILGQRARDLALARVTLNNDARRFLVASIRRDTLRRRRSTMILTGLLLVAVLAAAGAIVLRQQAQDQQRLAIARQLIAEARSAVAKDPRTALRLAVAAYSIHPSAETDADAYAILASTVFAGTLTGHTGAITTVAVSPDGRTIAAGGADRTVQLWDITDVEHPRHWHESLSGQAGPISSVAFASDGQTLASASDDGTVVLWNIKDSSQPRRLGVPLQGHGGFIYKVAFSPDGRNLAAADGDGTVVLWNVSDREHPGPEGQPLGGFGERAQTVAFDRTGNILAAASSDATVILWNVTDPTRPTRLGPPLTDHASGVEDLAFSPDGVHMATMGADAAMLWDISRAGRPVHVATIPTGRVDPGSVAFAADGNLLAVTGAGSTQLWDVSKASQPARVGLSLDASQGVVSSIAFTPDGRYLASAGSDNNVVLWDLTDPGHATRVGAPLIGHTGAVNAIAFSPDAQALVSGSDDTTSMLWNLTRSDHPPLAPPLGGHSDLVRSVAFSPDGRTLATASNDTTVDLWDLTNRAQPQLIGAPLSGHTAPVTSVAFSPDGRTLATASNDTTVDLWDLTVVLSRYRTAIVRSCAEASGGLDRSQWAYYITGLAFQVTCT
jgi:WD40 repeat protein